MMKKNFKMLMVCALMGVVAVAGISAYFTANDEATNKFEVESLDVELQEPTWDEATDTDGDDVPDFAEDITPNQTIVKDPQVKNIGNTDEYVFVKVTMPWMNLVTAQLDGTKNAAADTELFSINTTAQAGTLNAGKGLGATTHKVNDGWILVDTQVKDTTVEYIYAYATEGGATGADSMTVLAPEATTPKLFNSVTLCNAIEGQVGFEESVHSIDLDVFAIQTGDLGENKTTIPAEVLAIYLNQNK